MPEVVLTTSVPAPWGPIALAATERGVAALDHFAPPDLFARELERRFHVAPIAVREKAAPSSAEGRSRAAAHLEAATSALGAFIAGDLSSLEALAIDVADRPAWDRRVFEAVRGIPPGVTASYGQVARMIDRPGAARAVGGAVGRCPIGLVIPCHRVIAGDGSLGGYGGGPWGGRPAGLELKRRLLAREGVLLRRSAAGD